MTGLLSWLLDDLHRQRRHIPSPVVRVAPVAGVVRRLLFFPARNHPARIPLLAKACPLFPCGSHAGMCAPRGQLRALDAPPSLPGDIIGTAWHARSVIRIARAAKRETRPAPRHRAARVCVCMCGRHAAGPPPLLFPSLPSPRATKSDRIEHTTRPRSLPCLCCQAQGCKPHPCVPPLLVRPKNNGMTRRQRCGGGPPPSGRTVDGPGDAPYFSILRVSCGLLSPRRSPCAARVCHRKKGGPFRCKTSGTARLTCWDEQIVREGRQRRVTCRTDVERR
jgi:hypothetical protein